ncbi:MULTISPECIES: hypothetical protein [unclassified Rhizobium]|uniref:hypothetical protein n=1 Tax=unclassified Rhizobium TaxID=2613769 RepID=UPI000AFC3D5A|nr:MULTISPECIES: hypothetical protein [unclassified Rhizobium]
MIGHDRAGFRKLLEPHTDAGGACLDRACQAEPIRKTFSQPNEKPAVPPFASRVFGMDSRDIG